MLSTLNIDDSLMQKAMELAEVDNPETVVQLALTELIERRQRSNLFDLAGKIQFCEDFDHKAQRELKRVVD